MAAMTALGLASDGDLNALHAAVIRVDGDDRIEFVADASLPFTRPLRVFVSRAATALREGRVGAEDVVKADAAMTAAFAALVAAQLDTAGLAAADIDFVGVDGHLLPGRGALRHRLLDPKRLAAEVGLPVVAGFGEADLKAGGDGAPVTDLYLAARAGAVAGDGPRAVLHLGRVTRLVFVDKEGEDRLRGFDCGPGLDALNEWSLKKTGALFSRDDDRLAAGRVHTDILRMMMLAPFQRRRPPKRFGAGDFKPGLLEKLSFEDGAATLMAFIAASARMAAPMTPAAPMRWIAAGSGRRCGLLMKALRKALEEDVDDADALGWRADSLDAQGFAYLAACRLRDAPTSLAALTGVRSALSGGKLHPSRATL